MSEFDWRVDAGGPSLDSGTKRQLAGGVRVVVKMPMAVIRYKGNRYQLFTEIVVVAEVFTDMRVLVFACHNSRDRVKNSLAGHCHNDPTHRIIGSCFGTPSFMFILCRLWAC